MSDCETFRPDFEELAMQRTTRPARAREPLTMVVPPQGTRPQIWEICGVCCHVTAVSPAADELFVAPVA